jgi:osmotically-inducible protein OsmY
MIRSMIITTLFTASASLSLFAQAKGDLAKPSPASPAKATPTPAAAPAKAAIEAKQDAKETAKEVKSDAKTAASALDDASVARAVKEKFSSLPSLKDKNLDVSVIGGVATLKGKVDKRGLKGVATNAAKKIVGVKKVDNQIEIETKK